MFADPVALGFDPTMTCVPSDDKDAKGQYEILVQSANGATQTFRTYGVLHDGGGDEPVGRGTRVWKVRRVEHGEAFGELVALKDAWVDNHREREGCIDSRIRQSALSLPDADRDRLEKCLLTVVTHGDVLVNGAADHTRLITIAGSAVPVGHANKRGGPRSAPTLQTHYRIVYQEIGTPLRDEPSLAVIYKALAEVCGGAYSYLHVHEN